MKKKCVKKLLVDPNGPKYNTLFTIKGFQAETIDHEFTELIEVNSLEIKSLKDYGNYRYWKRKYSESICKKFNNKLEIPWKDVVVIKIQYLGEKEENYI